VVLDAGDRLTVGLVVLACPGTAAAKAAASAAVAPVAAAVIANDRDLIRPNTRWRWATARYRVDDSGRSRFSRVGMTPACRPGTERPAQGKFRSG
jgi:hypothetical protein